MQQQAEGALDIVWTNHSYHHPYAKGRPDDQTFMMTKGLDADYEILQTERLLIANGGTPSVFFRFPGLVSNSPSDGRRAAASSDRAWRRTPGSPRASARGRARSCWCIPTAMRKRASTASPALYDEGDHCAPAGAGAGRAALSRGERRTLQCAVSFAVISVKPSSSVMSGAWPVVFRCVANRGGIHMHVANQVPLRGIVLMPDGVELEPFVIGVGNLAVQMPQKDS